MTRRSSVSRRTHTPKLSERDRGVAETRAGSSPGACCPRPLPPGARAEYDAPVRILIALLGSVVAACSCGTRSTDVPPTGPTTGPAHPEPTTPAAQTADYEVHEWGLLRATAGDVLSAGAIGPPREVEPMAVDKPVLYFHTASPMTIARVAVDAHGGAIVEAWPSPPRTGDASELVWRNVAVDPTGECRPSPLPTASDTACTSLPAGDLCEVPSLALARTPGSACLHMPEATESLLFYRVRTRAFTPPLRFERRAPGGAEVTVTNEGGTAIPGWLVRMHDDYGTVSALAVRAPGPHESIAVGADFDAAARAGNHATADDQPMRGPANAEPGRRAIRDTLREIGLTEEETSAFLRAWDPALFALAPSDLSVDSLTASDETDRRVAPTDSFLYFLPAADCERVARLELDPPPRSITRALAVWSQLRPTGPSH